MGDPDLDIEGQAPGSLITSCLQVGGHADFSTDSNNIAFMFFQ